MLRFNCIFCGAVSVEEGTEEEARAAAKAASFVFIPVADPSCPVLMRDQVLCGFCASYVRSYVLAECGAAAVDVLDPDDRAFEEDTNY